RSTTAKTGSRTSTSTASTPRMFWASSTTRRRRLRSGSTTLVAVDRKRSRSEQPAERWWFGRNRAPSVRMRAAVDADQQHPNRQTEEQAGETIGGVGHDMLALHDESRDFGQRDEQHADAHELLRLGIVVDDAHMNSRPLNR